MIRLVRCLALAALWSLLASRSSLLAGQSPSAPPRDTLATVVVTATRVAVSTLAPTATATVIRGEELAAQGIRRVADALRLVPGVAVVGSGPVGSQTSLFVRGGNSNYVRVLIDGVPVNDAGGAFDWGSITTANVDRIEIVRGPASVLYGSDAVTGVVQVFTRDGRTGGAPAAASRAHASIGRGSHGMMSASAGGVLGNDRRSAALELSRDVTDGVLPFNNRWVSDAASASARVAPDDKTDLRVAARWSGATYQFPTDYTGEPVDRNSEQVDHRFVASIDAGRKLNRAVALRVLLASNEYLPRSNDGPDATGDTLGFYGFYSRSVRTRRTADARVDAWLDRRTVLSVGGELAHDRERSTSLSLSEYGDSPGGFEASRHNGALYAQLLGDASDRLSWSVGGRVDRNSAFGTFSTVRVSGAWILSATARVRASAGTAFKAPSFFENFSTGFVTGNPSLRPEQSRSAEVGVEQFLAGGNVTLRATAFAQAFSDVIDYTGTPPTATSPNYFNVAGADARGVELEASWRPDAATTLGASWSWTATRVTQIGFDSTAGATYVDGAPLIRRPAHAGTLSAARAFGRGGSVRFAATHVGRRDDRDYVEYPAAAVTLPAWTKVDVSTVVPSGIRGLAITARVDNVLAAKYEEIRGFDAPGRLVFVGARIGR